MLFFLSRPSLCCGQRGQKPAPLIIRHVLPLYLSQSNIVHCVFCIHLDGYGYHIRERDVSPINQEVENLLLALRPPFLEWQSSSGRSDLNHDQEKGATTVMNLGHNSTDSMYVALVVPSCFQEQVSNSTK